MILDKLKEVNRIKKVQSEVKKQLENIFVTIDKQGVKVVIRGDKHIERIEINGQEDKRLKELLNSSFKEVEKKVEKQMRGQLQDLGFPNL